MDKEQNWREEFEDKFPKVEFVTKDSGGIIFSGGKESLMEFVQSVEASARKDEAMKCGLHSKNSVKQALEALRGEIQKEYENIEIYTEKIDTAIRLGQIIEGFDSKEKMKDCITWGIIEMRKINEILALLDTKIKELP